MDVPCSICEDCGYEFAMTELVRDIEEDPVACPECGGLDIELVTTAAG